MIYWKVSKREIIIKEYRGGILKDRKIRLTRCEQEILAVISNGTWNSVEEIRRVTRRSRMSIGQTIARLNRKIGYKEIETKYKYGYKAEIGIF